MNDNKIIDFLNGRWFAVIAGILLAVTAAVAAMSGEVPPPEAGSGVFFNIPGAFIDNPWLSMAVNVGCIIGIFPFQFFILFLVILSFCYRSVSYYRHIYY